MKTHTGHGHKGGRGRDRVDRADGGAAGNRRGLKNERSGGVGNSSEAGTDLPSGFYKQVECHWPPDATVLFYLNISAINV